MDADDLIGYLRATFALDPGAPASLVPAGRGALGEVFRLEVGSRRYAVKLLAGDEPPVPALVAAEVAFTTLAAGAGVRVATGHPATDGRYAVPAPGGPGWLRVHDWLDGTPPDPEDGDLPALLGTLLGRLHGCAPAADREPDGAPPDEWFTVPPTPDRWPALLDTARAAGAAWAPDLAARLPLIGTLTIAAGPADPAAMVTCHRDLHPDNVLVTAGPPGGVRRLAVLDWDNLGPAEPGRELVRVLLDWFFDHDRLDVGAVRGMLTAYRAAAGPGRITPGAFGFAVASRLNFLLRQAGIALDAGRPARHRDWAVREIGEALRILPTPAALARLVEVDASLPDPAPGQG
jgi:Ser/Thr protein kinase RdoA (MazF antagonist)